MRAAVIVFAAAQIMAVIGWSKAAHGYQEKGQERVDYTAYTLRSWEASLGLLKAELGIPGGVMIGTYVPTWALGPAVGTTLPTAFVKLRDPFDGAVAVSVRAGIVYFDDVSLRSEALQNAGSKVGLTVLPFEAALSARFNPWFTQSLLATYVHVSAGGSDASDATIRGAAVVNNLSASTLLEVRLTRVTAITLLLRVLAYQGNARVVAQFSQGSTTVDADLGARPRRDDFVACAIPGVAFSGKHVNLHLGVGYGHWWLPVVELPIGEPQIVGDFNFYVRF